MERLIADDKEGASLSLPRSPLHIGLLALAVAVLAGAGIALLGPLLFLAGLVAVVASLLLATDPVYPLWCVLVVIVLLPFATLPVDIGVTPTFLEMTIVATIAVALFRQTQQARQELFVSPVGWSLLLFIGLALASFVLGIAHARPSITSLRRFADLLLSLCWFYVVANVLVEQRSLERSYRLLFLLGGLAAFIGVTLYFLPGHLAERLLVKLGVFGYPRSGVLRFIEDDPSQPMRAIGTSVDPNVFGGMLAFVGGLIVPQLFVPGSRRRLLLVWSLLGAVGVALLLTFSRSSMFGLAMALAALGLLRHRRLLWLLLAGGLLVLLLPPTRVYVQHFLEGVRGQDLATQMRFGEYKDAFILVSRYPWLGVGFTGVPDVDIYLGVSSVYLLIAEETGLVGLALFLATLMVFFAYTWPRAAMARREHPYLEALILGTETAVLAGMVAGVLDHYLFNLSFPHAAALLWTTVALGVAGARLAEARFASSQAKALA